jgi:signal transduction histidine kinase
MSIPTNEDFALEVRTDRLVMLWKVTLSGAVVLGWILFTITMLQRENQLLGLLPPLIVVAGCLLTREFLRRNHYIAAVWMYALGGVAAVAMLLYVGSEDLRQIVPFAFPIIVFVVGLLLPPSNTFLLAGFSTFITVFVPLLIPDGRMFLQESSTYIVVAIGFTFASALLAGQVTGELYKVTEWALLNYQRERKTTQALYESREALERSLRRSEALSDKLKETNTELEQARATAEAAKHYRGQFLANMSHELRTPLNAIIGFSETMLKFPAMYDNASLPKAYESDMNQIYTSGRQLLTLINDILDLSKVDAGKLEIHLGRVEITTIVDGVLGQAQGLIGEKPIKLEQDLPDHLPLIWADELRVRQVLLNLYSNAAKFTNSGSITLSVREMNEGVQFSVKDTGSGIDPKNYEVIFEEFKQAESAGRDPRSGAGLGLAITRQLLKLMGGRIWVESEMGRGSTFHFVVQAYRPADDTVRRKPQDGLATEAVVQAEKQAT